MGNRHPLSVKLKRNIKWTSIIYKYKEIKEKERIINKIILQKYKDRLISKPIYEYISDRIEVLIVEYRRNRISEEEEIKEIEGKIKERIKEEIKINKIEIKKPVLDSKIMGEYIMKRLRKNSINRIRKRIRKMIKIPKMREEGNYTYNWNKIKREFINKSIRSYIKGIYIEVKGRISKGRRAKRSTKYRINIGKLEYNKTINIIDYSLSKVNGKNGVYTLRIGINTDIIEGGDIA
uniref:ribosomal protein S3 n=1 Tax=Capillidium rhysosporum TaxID=181046 RepID=UPI0020C84E40|nr:ribosomal protein S3 [Capillidium rhysosporum]QWY25715.1 ribosomal protein S3 [Capillidium rhysosporum]